LPNLYIAYRTHLAEGSEVFHNNIRQRWRDGDQQVIDAMDEFASLAQQARDAIVNGAAATIGPLLDRNFDLRRTLFQLSEANIDLVERARSAGASAKFAGSGGAIVGVYEDDKMFRALQDAFKGTDTMVIRPEIAPGVAG